MATMMQFSSKTQVNACKRASKAVPASIDLTSSALRIPQAQIFRSAAPSPKAVAAPARVVVPRAAPAEAAPAPSKSSETKEWYALVASADFFFNDPQNESMAEQLREKVRFYKEQNKEVDFFIVPEPKWLDAKYPEQAKKVKRPAVALVAADKQWIIFMKLRLDRVLRFDLGTLPESEACAMGGEIPEFPQPEKWTAPYPRYTPGWWKVFYPKQQA